MKEELSLEKLKGVKLWITAGPREKFTASEVMYCEEQPEHVLFISTEQHLRYADEHVFTVLLSLFISAGGAEAVPGWGRKRPGHAR